LQGEAVAAGAAGSFRFFILYFAPGSSEVELAEWRR
jgi:hypothetical protein